MVSVSVILSMWVSLWMMWFFPQSTAMTPRPKEAAITLPSDYRDWTLVSNRLVTDASHPQYGFHYVYVNTVGKKSHAAKSAKHPDGTRFVMVFHEIKQSATGMVPGKRTRLSVMEKNSKAFPETGGWGFAQFVGDKMERRDIHGVKDCWGCHAPNRDSDFLLHSQIVESSQ